MILTIFSLASFSQDRDAILFEDSEQKPERAEGKTKEEEFLLESGNKIQGEPTQRHKKQNQEEVDPIFYDSTTSPAEMSPAR